MERATVLANLRTLALMLLGPPLLLLLWVHLIGAHGDGVLLALILAGSIGLAGAVTVPWRDSIKALVAAIYAIAAFAILPFLGLVAVCTRGDCI